MQRLQTKKEIGALTLLFCLTYTVSYMTRINYGAIISAMESATGLPKNMLAMSLTGSFITYGVGQILTGILGDRFSPKKLISLGFIVTSLMNFLIPFCKSPYLMLVVWCINGFAQALMWPPMVRMLTVLVDDESYKSVSSRISWGASFGTIAVYLISPLLLLIFDYRSVFFFCGTIGVIMLLVWNAFAVDVDRETSDNQARCTDSLAEEKTEGTNNTLRVLFSPMMLLAMLGIALQGMLRDGVTTWMPSYISETYQLSNIVSILSGVIMPIFSILCVQLSTTLYKKRFKNPLSLAGLFFLCGAVATVALYLFTGLSAVLSIFLSALLIGCMHGTNLMLTAMLPPFFKRYGKVSTTSGVLNSCTYVGSAISTYGIALLSENIGWHMTVLVWAVIALLGGLVCFLAKGQFARRFLQKTQDLPEAQRLQ